MKSRKATQSDFLWPLIKTAAVCLVVAQGALMLSPSLELSPEPFVYLAVLAFAAQSIRVLMSSIMAHGLSWRIYIILGLCLGAGTGIASTLPSAHLNFAATAEWLSQKGESVKDAIAKLETFSWLDDRQHRDTLGPTTKRIFTKDSAESLAEARRDLLAIPQKSPVYNQSRVLLKVVERRLDDVETKKGVGRNKKRPIQTTAVEQTGHGLRVTLRNNTQESIRDIRYRIEYFAAKGAKFDAETVSWIPAKIAPGRTSTVEIADERLNSETYGAFSIVSWDSDAIVD